MPGGSTPHDEDKLCRGCSELDLSYASLTERQIPKYSEHKVSLGTYGDIKSRHKCPLCRLVAGLIACSNKYDSTKKFRGINVRRSDDTEVCLDHQKYYLSIAGPASSFLRFVKSDEEQEITYGREALLLAPELIDLRLINKWRTHCERNHVDICGTVPAYNDRELVSLRFVDVLFECIVDAPLESKYVALSYVWGGVQPFKLVRDNQKELYTRYSLHASRNQLPKTLRDAIALTRDLRERYLWVDSLCLIQDSEEDLNGGLRMMDVVYEQAELTIIAASGSDANSGLPGYTRSKSRLQVAEKINDLMLVAVQDMSYHLQNSTYDQRAWTYQERYLSRRALVFVDDKVYWTCRSGTQSEEAPENDPYCNNQNVSSVYLPLTFLNHDYYCHAWDSLAYCVRHYTEKNLTYEQDVTRAIAGLLERIGSRMNCRLFHGIPTASFDLGILFLKLNSGVLRRRKRFPSWSWAGWKGKLWGWDLQKFEDLPTDEAYAQITDWLNSKTWIVWYKRSASGYVSPVWDPEANDNWKPSSKAPGYRQRQPFRSSDVPHVVTTRIAASYSDSDIRAQPHEYHLLQFWTLTAEFRCNYNRLFDSRGHVCGWIEWDGFTSGSHPNNVKLAILSEPWTGGEEASHDTYIDFNPFHEESKDLSSPGNPYRQSDKQYWIMALHTVKGGYMERRGIGKIRQKALRWSTGAVQWEEMLLG